MMTKIGGKCASLGSYKKKLKCALGYPVAKNIFGYKNKREVCLKMCR